MYSGRCYACQRKITEDVHFIRKWNDGGEEGRTIHAYCWGRVSYRTPPDEQVCASEGCLRAAVPGRDTCWMHPPRRSRAARLAAAQERGRRSGEALAKAARPAPGWEARLSAHLGSPDVDDPERKVPEQAMSDDERAWLESKGWPSSGSVVDGT